MAQRKIAKQIAGDTAEVKGSPSSTVLEAQIPDTLTKTPKVAKKKKANFNDVFKSTGKIAVKPFVDPDAENMGLEEYGFAVFPGTYHEEQLAAIERNGIVRFITGLDEFAPEVQNLNNSDLKEAVINNIRQVVAYLEKTLATNVIKVDDEDFWNKVELLKPSNHEFWGKISIKCSNEPTHLNPTEDPYDLIKFMAIEAGGFDLVAKSFEDAQAQAVAPKFFLDKEVHTTSSRTSYKKLRNKAISHLDKMYNSNPKKLFYVTKVLDTDSANYKTNTPTDVLYDVMDDFIAGLGIETKKDKAAERFIDTSNLDMETLKLKAIVKDATFFRNISLKTDGMLYHTLTSTMLGRNVADVVIYLKNPVNEDILITILQEVESFWNE